MVGPKVGSIYIYIYIYPNVEIRCNSEDHHMLFGSSGPRRWRPSSAASGVSLVCDGRCLPFRRNLGFGWVGFQLDRITKSGIEILRKYYHIHPHPLSGGVIVRLKLPKSCSNGLFSTAILQPELKLHETSLCSALSSAALAEELYWNVSTVFLGWKATYDLQQCHFQAVVAIACHFADVGEGRGWKCPVDALTMGPGPGKWLKNGKISTKMGFWCQEHQDISWYIDLIRFGSQEHRDISWYIDCIQCIQRFKVSNNWGHTAILYDCYMIYCNSPKWGFKQTKIDKINRLWFYTTWQWHVLA